MVISSPSTVKNSSRLITIVAHVDHGKTTLADSLLHHNNIISEHSAGKIRFLDSLYEEQRRGITIRSSFVALQYDYKPNPNENMIVKTTIHLMDNPGHIDFTHEVSSSFQVCDGALLLVDVIEGITTRMISILREAYNMDIVPILVLNKIDRLYNEYELNVEEAYLKVRNVIESINAACCSIDKMMETNEHKVYNETKKKIWFFEPWKGNVIFASALHGWGFTIPSLARSLYKKNIISIKPKVFKKYLYGDYCYDEDNGKVNVWKVKQMKNNLPLFSKFALEPLWNIYKVISSNLTCKFNSMTDEIYNMTKIGNTSPVIKNVEINRIIHQLTTLNSSTMTKYTSTVDILVSALMRRYRPLCDAILEAVCKKCPSPCEASSQLRFNKLSLVEPYDINYYYNEHQCHENCVDLYSPFKDIKRAIQACISDDTTIPTTAHVYKFITTDKFNIDYSKLQESLPCDERLENNYRKKTIILGLTRVLSGTLHANKIEYYCFGPKYHCFPSFSPSIRYNTTSKRRIQLYISMGASYLCTNSISAGHICAVSGLESLHYKTLTICSSLHGMPLCTPMNSNIYTKPTSTQLSLLLSPNSDDILPMVINQQRPLVKVTVEAESTSDATILQQGLQQLLLADAAVDVKVNSKNEHILSCMGELHLEQSILDLQRVYCISPFNSSTNINCKGDNDVIRLKISDPIVEFGESTDWFKNEREQYELFYSQSIHTKQHLLQQIFIPPYCFEDGLLNSKCGRSRVFLSSSFTDRPSAAISLRVLPLSSSVYSCLHRLKQLHDNIDETRILSQCGIKTNSDIANYIDCQQDIIDLAKALNLYNNRYLKFEGGKSTAHHTKISASFIIDKLSSLICAIDNNGNALIESTTMVSHKAIKAVVSDQELVYVLPTSKFSIKNSKIQTNKNKRNKKHDNENYSSLIDYGEKLHIIGKEEYESLQTCIQMGMDDRDIDTQQSNSSESDKTNEFSISSVSASNEAIRIWNENIKGNIAAGFQNACCAGPICEEPLRGVLVIIEGLEIALIPQRLPEKRSSNGDYKSILTFSGKDYWENKQNMNTEEERVNSIISNYCYFCRQNPIDSGIVVSAIRKGIRCALLTRPIRLVECHLRLTLHSSLSGLGSLYGILSKRRGKVKTETMVDGTDIISITVTLPQIESFHLESELLKKSSGAVTAPELVFSHWEVIQEDPFWIPTSLEEREDYGEIFNYGDCSTGVQNYALKYIRMIRMRKGLIVDSHKFIKDSEKQRTLARKK